VRDPETDGVNVFVDVFLIKESVEVVVGVVEAVELIVWVLETTADPLIVGDPLGVFVDKEDLDTLWVILGLAEIKGDLETDIEVVDVFDCPADFDDVNEILEVLDRSADEE